MDTQTAGSAPMPNGVVIIKLHGHVRMGEPIDRFRNEIDGNLAQ